MRGSGALFPSFFVGFSRRSYAHKGLSMKARDGCVRPPGAVVRAFLRGWPAQWRRAALSHSAAQRGHLVGTLGSPPACVWRMRDSARPICERVISALMPAPVPAFHVKVSFAGEALATVIAAGCSPAQSLVPCLPKRPELAARSIRYRRSLTTCRWPCRCRHRRIQRYPDFEVGVQIFVHVCLPPPYTSALTCL